jgi:uncharacterized damage-inducible protein DinB
MRAGAATATACSACEPSPAVVTLQAQLDGLRDLVSRLAVPVYRAAPSRQSGTIGAHVRHCLDHVRALVCSARSGDLCYDTRDRDTDVERDPRAAVAEIDRLSRALDVLDPADVDRTVRLRTRLDRAGTEMLAHSTLGREVAFAIQHTIHHAALIGVLLDRLGIAIPADFGYAPATPRRR